MRVPGVRAGAQSLGHHPLSGRIVVWISCRRRREKRRYRVRRRPGRIGTASSRLVRRCRLQAEPWPATHTGAFGAEMIHDHLGIMGLGVQGVARVADAVAGPDGYDPRQLALPPPPPLERDLWAGVAGARVGILAEGFTEHTEPDVGQAVLTAAEVLRSCGAEVGSATVPVHTKAMSIAAPLLYGSLGVWFDTAFAGLPQGGYVPTDLIEAVLHARSQDAPSLPIYVAAEAILGRYMLHQSAGLSAARSANLRRYVTDCYQRAFESFDLLVMPTVPIKAPRYEESEQPAENAALPLSGGSLGSSLNALTVNMWPFNFTGYPAMSIPCAVSDGLPIGMQIVRRRNQDDLVLRAGVRLRAGCCLGCAHHPRLAGCRTWPRPAAGLGCREPAFRRPRVEVLGAVDIAHERNELRQAERGVRTRPAPGCTGRLAPVRAWWTGRGWDLFRHGCWPRLCGHLAGWRAN